MGYVYILTNPAFKEDWIKIGKSSREVSVRSKELDNTSTPLPFEIYATAETKKYSELEKTLHTMIDSLTDVRIRSNREFFNMTPDKALELIKQACLLIDDAKIEIYNEQPTKTKRTRFSLKALGINEGELLIVKIGKFQYNLRTRGNRIVYGGEEYLPLQFLKEHAGCKVTAEDVYELFFYDGKPLKEFLK